MIDALIKWGIILAIVAAVGLSIRHAWETYIADPLRAEGMAEQHAIDEPIATGYLDRATTAEAQVNEQRQYAAAFDAKAKDAATNAQAAYELYLQEHQQNEKLLLAQRSALPADVAGIRIPDSVARLLDGTPVTAAVGAGSKGSTGAAGMVATSPGATTADTTLGAIADWGIACRNQYELATKQVNGWITYFNSLFP